MIILFNKLSLFAFNRNHPFIIKLNAEVIRK